MLKTQKQIGIYSGIFDPVHDGHIQLAVNAIKAAKLDDVYFLVEANPWRKTGVTHLAHRIAMVKIAIKTNKNLHLLELPDKKFSVAKTLPRLRQRFANNELFFIAGSDMLVHMPDWPLIEAMFKHMNLIIGRRSGDGTEAINGRLSKLSEKTHQILLIDSPRPELSSRQIREDLLLGKKTTGLNPEVAEYIRQNWLYASPSNSNSAL